MLFKTLFFRLKLDKTFAKEINLRLRKSPSGVRKPVTISRKSPSGVRKGVTRARK